MEGIKFALRGLLNPVTHTASSQQQQQAQGQSLEEVPSGALPSLSHARNIAPTSIDLLTIEQEGNRETPEKHCTYIDLLYSWNRHNLGMQRLVRMKAKRCVQEMLCHATHERWRCQRARGRKPRRSSPWRASGRGRGPAAP